MRSAPRTLVLINAEGWMQASPALGARASLPSFLLLSSPDSSAWLSGPEPASDRRGVQSKPRFCLTVTLGWVLVPTEQSLMPNGQGNRN